MSDFVPPYYAKLGKSVKDFFGKKFDIKNELKTINKSANGVKLESSFGGDTSLSGKCKGTYNFGDCSVEGEFLTVGQINGKFVKKKLVPGLEVSVSGKSKKNLVTLSSKYAQPFYALSADVNYDLCKGAATLDGSAMIGFDGLSVGVSAKVNPGAEDKLSDYNCGAEYTQDDLTLSLVTANCGNVITASYWQKLSGICSVGASLKMDPVTETATASEQYVLTVGTKYKLDSTTEVSVKGDTGGVVYSNIEHVLSNPNLKLVIGAKFDSNKSGNCVVAPDAFGISCTFGDF